jgi:hypothetical protein
MGEGRLWQLFTLNLKLMRQDRKKDNAFLLVIGIGLTLPLSNRKKSDNGDSLHSFTVFLSSVRRGEETLPILKVSGGRLQLILTTKKHGILY